MTKFALVIGVSDYEFGLNQLPQAANNAEAIEEVLLDPKWGNFERTNLLFLKNPDRQIIETAIEKLFLGRKKEDLLLLYFSGRGIKDSKGKIHLAAQNTRKNERVNIVRSEVENGVATKFIKKNMNRCNCSTQIVILDTCFSSTSEEEEENIDILEELAGDRRIIATSSTSTRYRFGKFGEELSEYTSSIIEGIKNGEGDLNNNGFISIREIHQYASEKLTQSDRAAKPQISIAPNIPEIELLEVYIDNPEEKYYQQVLEYSRNGLISPLERERLEILRQKLRLSPKKASALEDKVTETLARELQQKLARYERDYTAALKQELSPTQADLQRIKENLQAILELRDEDTQHIEEKVRSQVAAYRNHLREYEQILLLAMQKEDPLTQVTRNRLEQIQTQWQLSDRDVALAESRANLEVKKYREKLLEYEEEYVKAIEQQYPISETSRQALKQKQKSLGIFVEDIAPIEAKINQRFHAYYQKLDHYKEFLTRAIEQQYPLSEEVRQELKQIQQGLKLRDEDVITAEAKIVRQRRLKNPLVHLQAKERISSLQTIPKIKNKLESLALDSASLIGHIYREISYKIPKNIPSNLAIKIPKNPPINLAVKNPNKTENKIPERSPERTPNRTPKKNIYNNDLMPRRSYLKWISLAIIGGIAAVWVKNIITRIIGANQSNNPTGITGNRDGNNINNNIQQNPDRSPEESERTLPRERATRNLQTFQFAVVTVNSRGQQINSTTASAKYFTTDLSSAIDIEMVAIPGGSFTMGTPPTERRSEPRERPQHRVNVKPFYMSKYQVTQAQWRQVASLPRIDRTLDRDPSNFKGDRLPVETISWQDAVEFCKRLSQKTGQEYRLPSEAEWEYAARAGTTTPFYCGPTITGDLANYNASFIYTAQSRGRFRNSTIAVGSFTPNAFGLYDMHGNVWEWCQDTWHNNYSGAPADGSAWRSGNGQSRVIRGGSWHSDPTSCRSGYREPHSILGKYRTLGFRIVRE